MILNNALHLQNRKTLFLIKKACPFKAFNVSFIAAKTFGNNNQLIVVWMDNPSIIRPYNLFLLFVFPLCRWVMVV